MRGNKKYGKTKVLGYMKIKKLKDILVDENDNPDAEKNELVFAELIQFLDEQSFALVMHDAKDKGREAFKILREHYAGKGKPRIITLYNQPTLLKKCNTESITDYILRAETDATALKSTNENISDSLLVAMVLKGLPIEYNTFVAIITQSETVYCFQKFEQALRNFEETEKARLDSSSNKDDNSVMKFKSGYFRGDKTIVIPVVW